MRPWYTDNGGQTAYTIDAGHFEADVTALSYAYFHRDYQFYSRTAQHYAIGSSQLKVGLLNNVDAELLITPWTIYTDKYNSHFFLFHDQEYQHHGVGDLESRIRWNLWGNDGGPTALAVGGLAYWPTGTGSIDNEQFEGGGFVDFQAHLPADFDLRIHNNFISIVDYENNTPTRAREYSFQNTISLIHPIVGNLNGYVMFNTYTYTTTGRDWDGFANVGLTYRFRENLELYGGVDFGVHGPTADYSPFVGISARF